MSTTITGIVTNGVVVPNSPLPEGARVEIHMQEAKGAGAPPTPAALRKMPRAERQAVLAATAAMAEEDYKNDKDLTGFEAFSEELDDNSR